LQFWDATRNSRVNCAERLEIDQNNLRMKFSALNLDFSCPCLDPLDSKRPAHASVKEGYLSKKCFLICCCLV